ncbi:helix-turn-helix domain-containing protein [bacterium]|nr:helix-turn-helix domain-containing protein [bacterium]
MKTEQTIKPTWFSLNEASIYLRISTRSLQRAVATGKLKRNKVNGRYLFRRNWLDAFGCGFGPRLSLSQKREFDVLCSEDDS